MICLSNDKNTNDKTTIVVEKETRDKLDELATRKQTLNDIIKILISGYNASEVFEEAEVPESGRVRLTRAAGKVIEWRIKGADTT